VEKIYKSRRGDGEIPINIISLTNLILLSVVLGRCRRLQDFLVLRVTRSQQERSLKNTTVVSRCNAFPKTGCTSHFNFLNSNSYSGYGGL